MGPRLDAAEAALDWRTLLNRTQRGFCRGLLALAMCMGAAAGVASDARAVQESPVSVSRPIPFDAYADDGIAGLIERAMAQRKARAEGLTSFEATFRERIYAGLGGAFLRRERAMFHQERAARLRWAAEGEHIVRWLGVRRGVPIVGLGVEFDDDLRDDDAFELDFDMIDPASEHVTVGSEWALHPLADTAAYHYRYRSGDTLRIRFPGDDRTVTLIEAIVEPREARFDRIAGSLWFDADEGVLTRAAYRPAIEYDFDREEPEDADDVPGFVKPIRARVEFITIDYGLQELRWWLPNRMAFDAAREPLIGVGVEGNRARDGDGRCLDGARVGCGAGGGAHAQRQGQQPAAKAPLRAIQERSPVQSRLRGVEARGLPPMSGHGAAPATHPDRSRYVYVWVDVSTFARVTVEERVRVTGRE